MANVYKYKAIDNSGKMRHGNVEADNLLDLEQRLSGMGLDLITFKEVKPGFFSFRSKGITRQDLINFTFQMQQLTKSGVSILDGLADLKDSLPDSRMKEVLMGLIDEIQGGKTFSRALQEFPDIFDSVYVTLVQVGEESGRLPDVLKDMAETLKWQDELISHTKKIMIYPALVTTAITGVVIFLMIQVVPELIPFLLEVGGEIPLHTRALIATSNFLGQYWYMLLAAPVLIYFTLRQLAAKKPSVRMAIDRFKLRLYIFGPLILKINLARFSTYFAMMYASGLTVLDSLKISESLVSNAVLSQAIKNVREGIADGIQISDSFKSVDVFPPLIIRMLKVGENTGALDDALLNISYFYNREVRENVDKMEAAMSPVLTVVLGGIMLWIMSAVLGPIYDSLSKIQ
jgi:type IV pilus assembly protein PilC